MIVINDRVGTALRFPTCPTPPARPENARRAFMDDLNEDAEALRKPGLTNRRSTTTRLPIASPAVAGNASLIPGDTEASR